MRSTDTNQDTGLPGRSRRELLRSVALVALVGATGALTGCGLFEGEPEPPPAPDPLEPMMAGALDLAARYEAAIAAFPELADRLRPVAEAHRAHATELARVIGATPPPATAAPSPASIGGGTSDADVLRELRKAEQEGRDAAKKACTEAPADRAALVGSIAAARATHLEVVR
ncbi:hypothetical protein [Plantactinospora sp. B5E13]|uniref:hypothetical protein n=1 Tax=unclassified Plantactinospora TaxID=2631981 RepID=UPI00325F283B